jgi:hypothetical protein
MEFLGKTDAELGTDFPERSYLFRITAASEGQTSNHNPKLDLELFLPQIKIKCFTKLILSEKNYTHKLMADFCKCIGRPEWYVKGGKCTINAYDLINLFGYAEFKYEGKWNNETKMIDNSKKFLQPHIWLSGMIMDDFKEVKNFPEDEVFRDEEKPTSNTELWSKSHE